MIPGHRVGPLLDSHDTSLASGKLFLDCVGCDNTISWHVEYLAGVSDEQAQKYFNKKGWSVKPTLCPGCIKKVKSQLKLIKKVK